MKQFSFETATEKDLPDIRELLSRHEVHCTALTGLFCVRNTAEKPECFSFPVSGLCRVLKFHRAALKPIIAGLLYISSSGLVYHCFPFFEDTVQSSGVNSGINDRHTFSIFKISSAAFTQIGTLCSDLLKTIPITSIMGSAPAGLFLESCVNHPPKEIRMYELMYLKNTDVTGIQSNAVLPSTQIPIPVAAVLRRCYPENARALFPLVKAYYKEEVLSPQMDIGDDKLYLLLTGRLRTQFVFGMELGDGSFAATAGTNTIGIRHAQIGGVYTHPSFRRKGCAFFLIQKLCTALQHIGYTPVLFVRHENTAAQALYKACGFSVCGNYRISYF